MKMRFTFVAMMVLLAGQATLCTAQEVPTFESMPESEALIEGLSPYQQLLAEVVFYNGSGQHRRASDLIVRMLEVRPYDASLWFLLAQSLNRQERWKDAYGAADIAIQLHPESPHYRAERAAAALELGRFAQAESDASTVVAAMPFHLMAQYVLAESQLALGKFEAAEASFDELAEQNPALENASHFWRGEIARESGDEETAIVEYAQFPPIAEATFPSSGLVDLDVDEGASKWSGYLSLAAAWNSNVLSASDGAVLPSGISSRADWAITMGAGAFYRAYANNRMEIIVGSRFYQAFQMELTDFDVSQITPTALWRWRINERWGMGFELDGEVTWLGGRAYRWSISPSPFVAFTWPNGRQVTRLAVQPSVVDYFDPACCVLSRDGVNTTLTLSHQLAADWGALYLYWQYGWMATDGTEYQGDFTSVGVNLQVNLPAQFKWQARAGFSYYWYDNPSAFSPVGRTQQVPLLNVGTRLARPVFCEDLEAFVDYNYLNNDSNVQVYNYDQHLVRFGVTFEF